MWNNDAIEEEISELKNYRVLSQWKTPEQKYLTEEIITHLEELDDIEEELINILDTLNQD